MYYIFFIPGTKTGHEKGRGEERGGEESRNGEGGRIHTNPGIEFHVFFVLSDL